MAPFFDESESTTATGVNLRALAERLIWPARSRAAKNRRRRLGRVLFIDMADGDIPAPCTGDVYEHGVCFAVVSGGRSWNVEQIVRAVAALSGTEGRTDWHYVGGRARLVTTGDANKAKTALRALWPHFAAAFEWSQMMEMPTDGGAS